MLSKMGILYLSLLIVPFVLGANEDFKTIGRDEFEEKVKAGEKFFLAFVKKSCEHCKKLAEKIPEFEKLAKKAKLDVKFYRMDANSVELLDKELMDELKIPGVPTIYFYNGDRKGIHYNAPREGQDLFNFANNVVSHEIKQIKTKKQLDEFKKSSSGAILFILDSEKDVEKINELSHSMYDKLFGYALKKSEAGKSLSDYVYVYGIAKPLSLNKKDYEEKVGEKGAFAKWVKLASLQLISTFPKEAADIFSAGIEHVLFYIEHSKAIEEAIPWLEKLATRKRGKLIFATIDRDDESTKDALEFFGIEPQDTRTAVRIFSTSTKQQYRLDFVPLDEGVLKNWLNQFDQGLVDVYRKSQALPEGWDEKPVKILVNDNFESIALDPEFNVFVKFYAPWCTHCQNMLPEFEDLAKKAQKSKKMKNVVIAKIDATENDIDDGFKEIEGFPTLRLYKANSNDVIEYSGDRTTEEMFKFLEENVEKYEPKKTEEKDEL
ncbi:hypothetical protein WR25_05340 [Diploscapter pachys]|uniref:protein disulfide-isomerase n=1 Tax=Diploscapter pachys TaxID=2018661 RepID=A0A2A2LJ50_9BILA|nr:hypothetical protein WR25_05340 [Diploscapter pachys]